MIKATVPRVRSEVGRAEERSTRYGFTSSGTRRARLSRPRTAVRPVPRPGRSRAATCPTPWTHPLHDVNGRPVHATETRVLAPARMSSDRVGRVAAHGLGAQTRQPNASMDPGAACACGHDSHTQHASTVRMLSNSTCGHEACTAICTVISSSSYADP